MRIQKPRAALRVNGPWLGAARDSWRAMLSVGLWVQLRHAESNLALTVARSGHPDLRAQAVVPSALRADTPTLVALADVTAADWRTCGARAGGATEERKAALV